MVILPAEQMYIYTHVSDLLAISGSDNSGDSGPQAKGIRHLENHLRQLHASNRASSASFCAKQGGDVQLYSKPRGACGIESKTFGRRGQLLSHLLTSAR